MLYKILLNRLVPNLSARLKWISSSNIINGKKFINKKQRTVFEPINMEEHSSLLSRVTVVDNVEQSKMIVEKILNLGQPVAVDMEGVAEGVTSMVQVCDSERNISLFRTGFNPRLYWEGGLARILESPYIMKIMHAASGDCLSAYKDGVRLWNMYDTCVAHRVLEYQINGRSLYSSPQIGFNPLCNYCGLQENKMKERFQDILWKMIITKNGTNGLTTAKELQDDVILYCALDVEPLHEIHNILSSLVAPDYSYLVTQLSEVEIIRAINPDLAKKKRKSLQNMESCNIFLSHLRPSSTKPDLYSKLASLDGLTHIYYSDIHNTANIILESRSAAISACSRLTDLLEGQIRLMNKIQPTEIMEPDQVVEFGDDEVTTTLEIRNLVDRLATSGSPVVIDFHQFTNCSTLELYYGQLPSVKILLTKEMLEEGGLGLLISSHQVVKVIYRLDVSSVQAALKIFSQHGIDINNVFEIDGAMKMTDYAAFGLSIFRAQSRNIQAVVNSLGLSVEESGRSFRLDWYYLTYLHLLSIMGDKLRSLLTEKLQLEVAIGYGEVAAKDDRKNLRKRLEDYCVHIRFKGENNERLKSLVMRTLLARDILLVDYIDLNDTALIFLNNKEAVKTAILDLEREQKKSGVNFTITSPYMDNFVVEKSTPTLVNIEELVKFRDLNVVKVIGLEK